VTKLRLGHAPARKLRFLSAYFAAAASEPLGTGNANASAVVAHPAPAIEMNWSFPCG